MSSSNTSVPSRMPSLVSSFQYRSTDSVRFETTGDEVPSTPTEPEITLKESTLAERLASARKAGFADAEAKMRQEFQQRSDLQVKKVSEAIENFDSEQKDYFDRVEAEVVQLALSIAGKILHREAQVDPMLVAAIVHLALRQLKESSAVTLRVRPEDVSRWLEHFAAQVTDVSIKVLDDPDLEPGDCILETELGTVNFSLDAQLKEVERGFFDVLAQKPKV